MTALAGTVTRSPHWLTIDRQGALALLADWADRGWLRELDRALAVFIATQLTEAPPLLLVAAALASHQLGRGHLCLDLKAALADPRFVLSLPPDGEDLWGAKAVAGGVRITLPDQFLVGLALPRWREQIIAGLQGADAASAPLVIEGDRLYLRRFWRYERAVGADIAARLKTDPNGVRDETASSAVIDLVRTVLDTLFVASAQSVDWQKCACALALRSGFSVITGGPGTGKTTTVIRLLALLQALAFAGALGERAQRQGLRILLAAPTGKAAARLNESIAGAVSRLMLDGLAHAERIRQAIPTQVVTLHRLLGSRPDTRKLRHDRTNPLMLDVLVVDEASMIDLEMMYSLLQALPSSARLIVLGDKDQLASVEAGAVLGELCRHAAGGHYSTRTRDWLRSVAGVDIGSALLTEASRSLDQSIAMLRHSHRFSAESGIGRLATAVNEGDDEAALEILSAGHSDLALVTTRRRSVGFSAQRHAQDRAMPGEQADRALIDSVLANLVIDGGVGAPLDAVNQRPAYRAYLTLLREADPGDQADEDSVDQWARAGLEAFGRFQLLCATRRGGDGVVQINRSIERLLDRAGFIDAGSIWYAGRPVMVTRNDYSLGLMNGDVGIAISCPVRDGSGIGGRRLRVAFLVSDGAGKIRWVLPSRLQAVETVYAMTVHKAQGSEFDHAALWLPARSSPVLTRELVYTAITRARHWFTLSQPDADADVFRTSVTRQVQRASALGDLTDSGLS